MSRDASAGLVGGVFGLVFVLVNAGDLPAPLDLAVRVVGVMALVAVVGLLLRSGGGTPLPEAGPRAWKVYRIAVGVEIVALFGGASLLSRTGHEELGLPWVVVVVGVHFIPLGWAFGARFFVTLGWILVALGVLGAILALAGAERPVVSFVSGVGAGLVLLAFAARPALVRPPRDPQVPAPAPRRPPGR